MIAASPRRGRHLLFWLLLLGGIFGFLYLVRSILLPFVVALAIAYFFDPIANRLQRAGLPRWLSATLIMAGFGLIFAGVLILIVPILEQQITALLALIPGWVDSLKSNFMPFIGEYLQRFGVTTNDAGLREAANSYAAKALAWFGTVLGGVWASGLALIDLLSLLLIMPVVAFYLLRDWSYLVRDIDGWLPRDHAKTIRSLGREIDRTLSGFIRGQAIVCIIQATYYATVLTVEGLNFGVLVGISAGVLTFIPYIGALLGLFTSVAIAIAQWHDMFHVLVIAGSFGLGQIIESNFVTPALVGDRIGLHPAWVIFSLLAGGALFGFPGILLGVPIAAVIGVFVRYSLTVYLGSRFYKGEAHRSGA